MRRIALTLLITSLAFATHAADWPAWRGPDRTGISKEKGLLKTWPAGGPKLLWTNDKLGMGYSSPAVVGETIYICGSDDGNKEHLFALGTKEGKELWKTPLGDYFDNDRGGGPRGTPTVDGDHVYALGGQGTLICALTRSGKIVWQINLRKDLGGGVPNWGYSESPLVDGDKVIVTPGGRRGTLAALDKKTGKVLWRSEAWKDNADYASVVVGNAHKTRQYVQMAGTSVGGVDAATGKLLWHFEREHRITVPTPITSGNYVYVASGYEIGSTLLELTAVDKVKEVYSTRVMQNHHGGVILLDGHVYGYCNRNGLICQRLKDGEIVWRSNKVGKGSIVCVDGHLVHYAERDGTVTLVEATKDEYKEKGRFTVPKATKLERPQRARANVWAHPVVANGRLYLRDQECLFCYDVKDGGTP